MVSQCVRFSLVVVSSALVYSKLPLSGEILANVRTFDHGISVDEILSRGSTISFGVLNFCIDQ
jgi:hypothetical protein